ncbi:apoptosis regulatory protein Siva isoform X2 [Pantherophis guttatus]|uniref:Apoptosis regulatory protein Siva isoform X2 n=1 Tax=Pantherophis guttatus TaxID=94885 RepID=A0A6P9BSZ4_PANGU|nr:apoptosis regulatory protein Siva isoform X2 [Pantherophis guttatus]
MPKRSCPFADSSPVQLKTRVRLKELSQGVMGERYRREIFEKTKQLLFKGAQTYMNNTCNASAVGTYLIAQYPESCIDKSEICSWHRCNGQMLIGQDGKLRQPCASEMDQRMLEIKSFAVAAQCTNNKQLFLGNGCHLCCKESIAFK